MPITASCRYEGKVGQTFTIDIDLDIDLTAAARSDKVVDTVSYDKVVDCARDGLHRAEVQADRGRRRPVADAVLEAFPRVRKIKVTIHKPHAPIAATFSDVGVTLERARDNSKS